MSEQTKQFVVFLREPPAPGTPMAAFEKMLGKICSLAAHDLTPELTLAKLREAVPGLEPGATIFLDLTGAARCGLKPDAAWRDWNLVLVTHEPSGGSFPWAEQFSVLHLPVLNPREWPRVIQLAVAPQKFPGVASLAEKGSEIYYEKVTSVGALGVKVDRILTAMEKAHPPLAKQHFNVRQLSYALLHHALDSSSRSSRIVPVVDFQLAAQPERVSMAVRFNAPAGSVENWFAEISAGTNLALHHATIASDLLVLTELTDLDQVEIKVLVSAGAAFAGKSRRSLLALKASQFLSGADALAQGPVVKTLPISSLPASPEESVAVTHSSPAPTAASGDTSMTEGQSEGPVGMGTQLNFKVKADMLANEKNQLQGIVKKKSQLIAELTKDVNRAQLEAEAAQKNATKELVNMRREVEKAKNETRAATKKLNAFQRKAADEAAAAQNKAEEGPKRDFETELKQAEIAHRTVEAKAQEQATRANKLEEFLKKTRAEAAKLMTEKNELKAKLQALAAAATGQTANADASPATNANGMPASKQEIAAAAMNERMKEMNRVYTETKTREQDLDKEVKHVTIRLETAEKNLKAVSVALGKKVEAAEKALEEAKKQKSEALKKLEEAQAEAKKKLEEGNERERALKAQIEELKAGKKAA